MTYHLRILRALSSPVLNKLKKLEYSKGAKPETVLKMIVLSGAKIALLGLFVGVLGSAALTRLLEGLLYETEALDPITFVGMSLALFIVGLFASYLPARQAAAVDPMESLRME